MDSKFSLRTVAILSLFSILLTSCSTVPVTGRRQFNIMSDTEVVKMTKAAFDQMKAQMPISKDPRMNEWLTNVGERISQQVFWDMPLAEWEFVVFDAPGQINAFAMPGGKIGVFSGIFDIAQTEDELASIIAHEISHVTARHTHEKLSQAGVMKMGSNVSGMTMGGLGGLVWGAGTAGTLEAWDRGKESEADHIGIMYMAKAGYDPRAAITVMEKMAAMDVGGPASQPWNSTHPSSQERLDALHGHLEEALKEYERAKELLF